VTILLLRHVHAGDRGRSDGRDDLRPISERGRRQAEALVTHLAAFSVTRIVSSPYTRCVQSVLPLAAAHGIEVDEHDDLAEGTPLEQVQRLMRTSDGGATLLCSHGDVIGDVVLGLRHRGVDLGGEPRWAKGSTWVLEGDPMAPTRATYLPPPA
jgi:broad specificity phosphatase PhoE